MTKYTTLSAHIGDANHLYEVGETREIDEQNTVQHLIADKVLGPYDEAAEAAWRDAQATKATAQPTTKVDADASVAALSTVSGAPTQATVDALTKERDDARSNLEGMTGERDSARSDLSTLQATVDALTKERDDAVAELATLKAAAPRGKAA